MDQRISSKGARKKKKKERDLRVGKSSDGQGTKKSNSSGKWKSASQCRSNPLRDSLHFA